MTVNGDAHFSAADLRQHLDLLQDDHVPDGSDELRDAPILTEPVRRHALSLPANPIGQYGLLGVNREAMAGGSIDRDSFLASGGNGPQLYQNITAPWSAFICGSQGSGKSHTLSCTLENCLAQSSANVLPRPLTGIVFHYDHLSSDVGGTACEAAYLSSNPKIKVRVLCPPTNIRQIQNIYSRLPNVTVQELHLDETDLDTRRMLDLMAISSIQGGGMPLYLHVVTRILRQLRIAQQASDSTFNYRAFKQALDNEDLTPGQRVPLQQRLETLESFMAAEQVPVAQAGGSKKKNKGKENTALVSKKRVSDWNLKSGQLTIIDLSCPCVTPEMACALFNICLSLFLQQPATMGRIIALDEAHKYMTNSADCEILTEALLSTIRLQRHHGARVIVCTQEPTISPKLLDLCSMTIVHRFTSPSWLRALTAHLAGAAAVNNDAHGTVNGEDALTGDARDHDFPARLFSEIVELRTGEALLFAPSALVGVRESPRVNGVNGIMNGSGPEAAVNGDSGGVPVNGNGDAHRSPVELLRLKHGYMKIRVRKRITQDGGRSVMAT